MSKAEIIRNIEVTEAAIARTTSCKCRRDLQKYVRRLRKELRRKEATK